MTERERWVVYPLLFLALGAALRDKLVDRTTTKSIKCQELVIEEEPIGNQPGRVLAKIGRTETTPSAPAIGYVFVKGEVDVDGLVKVDGVINAKQYAYQNIPFMPAWQPFPAVQIPHGVRPLQQPGTGAQKSNASKSQSQGQPSAAAPQSSQDPATTPPTK